MTKKEINIQNSKCFDVLENFEIHVQCYLRIKHCLLWKWLFIEFTNSLEIYIHVHWTKDSNLSFGKCYNLAIADTEPVPG